MSTAAQPLTSANPEHPYGRWDDEYRKKAENYSGLRGVRTYDVTNPEDPKLLCEFSTGKTGSGTHMNFYDGGRLRAGGCGLEQRIPDGKRAAPERQRLHVAGSGRPGQRPEVSRWHIPGQLYSEDAEYRKCWFAGTMASWTSSHGGLIRGALEDGGKMAFCGFGHFGMVLMDLVDPKHPKVISQYRPAHETMGGIPFSYDLSGARRQQSATTEQEHTHHRHCARLSSRTAAKPFKPVQVIDVKDLAKPHLVGFFPRAGCAAGRALAPTSAWLAGVSAHTTRGSWIAPGTARPEIIVLAVLQRGCAGVGHLRSHAAAAGGLLQSPRTSARWKTTRAGAAPKSETAYVEWDRKIIWLRRPGGNYGLIVPRARCGEHCTAKILRSHSTYAGFGFGAAPSSRSLPSCRCAGDEVSHLPRLRGIGDVPHLQHPR